jgi:multisubunit Na+/H+ antiporter MnhG subunit
MESIARFLVSTVDLLEAEAAYFQRGVVRLGFALCAVIAGLILALIGTCLVLWAGWLLLEYLIGPIAATAVSGILFLLIAAGLLRVAWLRATRLETITTNSRSKASQTADENADGKKSSEKSTENYASHASNNTAYAPGATRESTPESARASAGVAA